MRIAALGLLGLMSFTSFASAQSSGSPSCKVVLRLEGFRNQKGVAGVAVFKSPDGWPEDNSKAFAEKAHPFTGDQTVIELHLPPGRYAFAALHDENSNHKLDRNLFGFPKEGFGFSNNPKVAMSAPPFDRAAMNVVCPVTDATIHLIYK